MLRQSGHSKSGALGALVEELKLSLNDAEGEYVESIYIGLKDTEGNNCHVASQDLRVISCNARTPSDVILFHVTIRNAKGAERQESIDPQTLDQLSLEVYLRFVNGYSHLNEASKLKKQRVLKLSLSSKKKLEVVETEGPAIYEIASSRRENPDSSEAYKAMDGVCTKR